MRSEVVRDLVSVKIEMTAAEAGALYAELYRLSADELRHPYPGDGMIAMLMRELIDSEAPGT